MKSDGSIWTWGANNQGQLGNNSFTDQTVPIQVDAIDGVSCIGTGLYHSFSIKTDNTVYSWGLNDRDQLGITRMLYSSTPIQSLAYTNTIDFETSSYSISLPYMGTKALTVRAFGIGDDGNRLFPTYSLENAYPGVTIDGNGVITVTSLASVGSVNIIATYGDLTCSAVLYLRESIGFEMTLPTTANSTYLVSVTASNVPVLNVLTYTLTYDDDSLQITDLCAFTYEKEMTTGLVAGTRITIISFTPGVITFTVDESVPSSKQWSGVLNIFEFKAKTSGDAIISFR
jgi:hypothetical protein